MCSHWKFALLCLPGFEASFEIKWVRPPTKWTDGDRSGTHILTTGKHSWHYAVNSHTEMAHTEREGCVEAFIYTNP